MFSASTNLYVTFVLSARNEFLFEIYKCPSVCMYYYYIVYLMVSVEQPDDGPIAGPKHVVVIYYIVLFMI